MGPSDIDPLAADYAERFAAYALEVARRFPWIDTFLPVNEPLTTARFGALYGWWEPHTRDHETFIHLLLAECLAMRAATRALRRLRPDLTIIANEDLGTTSGTPEVRHAVRFDNERRWLTFDLLTGRVGPDHPMWDYLSSARDVERQLAILGSDPEPPDVLGINHYVTSDRFLDHRLSLYPDATHGGDGRVSYADVESVRVDEAAVAGFEPVIEDAWSRYGTPLALTEVQLSGGSCRSGRLVVRSVASRGSSIPARHPDLRGDCLGGIRLAGLERPAPRVGRKLRARLLRRPP